VTIGEAWRTLNVTPRFEAALKSVRSHLAKQFHPDRYASFDRKVWAGEFIRVKQAYDLLRRMDGGAGRDGRAGRH
jgi:DnaJ-class molecular chaperone